MSYNNNGGGGGNYRGGSTGGGGYRGSSRGGSYRGGGSSFRGGYSDRGGSSSYRGGRGGGGGGRGYNNTGGYQQQSNDGGGGGFGRGRGSYNDGGGGFHSGGGFGGGRGRGRGEDGGTAGFSAFGGQSSFGSGGGSMNRPMGGMNAFQSKIVDALKESCLQVNPTNQQIGLFLNNLNTKISNKIQNVNLQDEQFVLNLSYAILNGFPNLYLLDLSENNLDNLDKLFPLKNLQNLQQLSLQKNNILTVRELNTLKGINLKTLILKENPCYYENPTPEDITEILRIFPNLEQLDNILITEEIKQSIIGIGQIKYPPINIDSAIEIDKELILNFIKLYFNYFDNNRQQLPYLFDKNNFTFSFSFNFKQTISGEQESQESKDVLNNVKNKSRNIKFLCDNEKLRNNRNIFTDTLIKSNFDHFNSFLNIFPKTHHNINKLIIDCIRIPKLDEIEKLLLTIHGQCTQMDDKNSNFSRTFDTTMILIPSGNQNLPITILNQQYHLRPYAPIHLQQFLQSNTPTTTNTTTVGNTTVGTSPPNIVVPQQQPNTSPNTNEMITLQGLNNDQIILVKQFSEYTKLTLDYARKCLESAQFIPDKAVLLFEQYKTNLPKEAFIQ